MTATTARHRRPPRTLLGDHDFRLLLVGDTASKTGTYATVIAVPIVAVTVLDASILTVGVLEAFAWLPFLLFSLLAGAWVDATSRRAVMHGCNWSSAVMLCSVPAAVWFDVLTLPHLAGVAFGVGVARVFFIPASQAYLPAVLPKGRLVEANSWLKSADGAAEIGGPSLAGGMAHALGAATALLADAASFVVYSVCLWRIRAVEPPPGGRSNAGLGARIREGLAFATRDRYLRVVIGFMTAANLVQVALQTLLVVFLIRTVGVNTGTAGLLMAGMGVGALVGATVIHPLIRRWGNARAFLVAETVTAGAGLLLPLTRDGWRLGFFVAGLVVLYAGVVGGSVIAQSWRQAYTPDAMMGRVTSVIQLFLRGGMPIGALLGGWAGTVLGLRGALWACGVGLFLPLAVLYLSPIARRRDLPTEPEPKEIR